ncbi:MAG TPA: GNAT family N-acetyltransferase [Micromonospora sp.]|nr:GNAT family N-acetyltransferase [Micromonospora sp.]
MLRIEPLDPRHNAVIAAAVLELQRAAYTVEAELIGSVGIPALQETLTELRAAPQRWLGAHDADGLVGAVAYERLADGTLDICKLLVVPSAFRRGIGTALLDALDAVEPAERIIVSTGTANTPARRLYEGRGFVRMRDVEVAPALWITQFERCC